MWLKQMITNSPVVAWIKNRIIRICPNKIRFCLLATLLSAMLFESSCLNSGPYATFKQPDFSYEYPKGWRQFVDQYSDFISTNVWDPTVSDNESSVGISVSISLGLGTKAEQQAQDGLSGRIASLKEEPDFTLISKETINLDGNSGYQAEYTYGAIANLKIQPRSYIPTRVLDISIPRDGKVYDIKISASQNEWNTHQTEIQHVLDTFKWK
jgi:hypothetical protein